MVVRIAYGNKNQTGNYSDTENWEKIKLSISFVLKIPLPISIAYRTKSKIEKIVNDNQRWLTCKRGPNPTLVVYPHGVLLKSQMGSNKSSQYDHDNVFNKLAGEEQEWSLVSGVEFFPIYGCKQFPFIDSSIYKDCQRSFSRLPPGIVIPERPRRTRGRKKKETNNIISIPFIQRLENHTEVESEQESELESNYYNFTSDIKKKESFKYAEVSSLIPNSKEISSNIPSTNSSSTLASNKNNLSTSDPTELLEILAKHQTSLLYRTNYQVLSEIFVDQALNGQVLDLYALEKSLQRLAFLSKTQFFNSNC